MDISIVIVSYNTKEYLIECLQSLHTNSFEGTSEVFVVDNASSDGSADMVERRFPGVSLIKNDVNAGFSAAVNQSCRRASGRYVLLLNPDTLVLSGAIGALFSYMESHPEVGAAGPRQWLDTDKRLQSTVTVKPPDSTTLLAQIPFFRRWVQKTLHTKFWSKDFDIWTSNFPIRVDTLNGSCMLVRRKTIEDVGVLDEDFFLFFEDADWCVRMRKRGWELWFVPASEIVHFGMRSVLLSEGISEIARQSLNHYIKKHMSPSGYLLWKIFGAKRLLRPIKRLILGIKNVYPLGMPEKSGPHRKTSDGDVTLFWNPEEVASGYLFEISTDPLFLYKAGTVCRNSHIRLPLDLVRQGPKGPLLWRVAPVYEKKRLGVFTGPYHFSLEKAEKEDS